MSARPLSPRTPRARRSRTAPAASVLAAALVLAPALTSISPAAGADPGQVVPERSVPSEMPFGDQGSDDSRSEKQQPENELADKAEKFGGSVVNEVIDLATGIVKCGLNLATDSVPCPL